MPVVVVADAAVPVVAVVSARCRRPPVVPVAVEPDVVSVPLALVVSVPEVPEAVVVVVVVPLVVPVPVAGVVVPLVVPVLVAGVVVPLVVPVPVAGVVDGAACVAGTPAGGAHTSSVTTKRQTVAPKSVGVVPVVPEVTVLVA